MTKGILIALALSVAIVAFGWLAFSIFDKKRWKK